MRVFRGYRAVSRECNRMVEEVGKLGLWSNGYTELVFLVSLVLLGENEGLGFRSAGSRMRGCLIPTSRLMEQVPVLAVQPGRRYNERNYMT